ncbi:MAG: LysE family translocator [Hyphomicrobium sp.]|nr:LysE family translocator [Hyphomicrobium sp.]
MSAAMFAVVTSFTPGPNNAMLLASGVNYGFRRTLPHILGITIGYAVMFAAVAMGVGQIFAAEPRLYAALQVFSVVYMLWLAWKIANAGDAKGDASREPLTFLQAALFQWINPKGVAIAIAAAANFLKPESLAYDLPVMLALILFVSLTSASTWALFGQGVSGLLGSARRRQVFNWTMAVLLVASLWPLIADGVRIG